MRPMRTTVVRELWVLSLVPNMRFGRVLAAGAILFTLLGVYTAAGIFGQQPTRATPSSAAVFFAAILAYIVPAFHYIVARCKEAFDELAPRLSGSSEDIAAWRAGVSHSTARSQLLVLGIGVVAGLAHNAALTGTIDLIDAFVSSFANALVMCSTLLVWVVMTSVIAGLFAIARLFARLGRRVRIDLLQPRALTPFARVAVILTLVIIGAQAAFPLLWLDATVSPLATIPGLVGTAVPMLFLFAMSLLPVHRAIAAAKAAEIRRLDTEVAAMTAAQTHPDARVADLAPLLVYRREVESVHEWPFDMGVSGRLAFYLVIPPLTWIGAALIQHFVEGAL